MTITVSLLLDVILLALLVYFVFMGIRRGLILTLCSLLAVVLAIAGGWYLSKTYTAPLQAKLEPVIVEHLLSRQTDDAPEPPASSSPESPADSEQLSSQETSLLNRFSQGMQNQLNQSIQDLQKATTEELGAVIAGTIAKAILFLAGFLAVLLIWTILCHGLNLVAKLPVLHGLNKLLGGVFGLVQGILLLSVARWALCDLLGWIPAQVAAESRLLSLLASLPLGSLLPF